MAFFMLLSPALSAPFSFADNARVELVRNLEVKKGRIILSGHHFNASKLLLHMYHIEDFPFFIHSWVIKMQGERAACSGRFWVAQQNWITILCADYYTVIRILLRTVEIKLNYSNSVLVRVSCMPWDTTEKRSRSMTFPAFVLFFFFFFPLIKYFFFANSCRWFIYR